MVLVDPNFVVDVHCCLVNLYLTTMGNRYIHGHLHLVKTSVFSQSCFELYPICFVSFHCCTVLQTTKGIYLDKTPAEGAVERAHLTHTLAHGLAHRPALAELSHKGVYLDVGLSFRIRVWWW